ncbi:hypothetical protein BS50DRAFT_622076 [Corynespora cassiicola Philippines]|uniref:Uncharacterized protein n=1 Tax=Corynespora cassiicola Philippines TaxID=1448308 RepID=A0A2T2NMA3_CORCC|nr:hypothetical protein BS50DRAFT_622076 [Corynespora cassiicola Philippines]
MTAVLARSPLQSLPMATNRPTTRRRSSRQAFEEDDAPAPKRPKTDVNGAGKRTNGAAKKSAKTAYDEDDDGFQFTRRTSKRASKAAVIPEPIPENEPAKIAPAPARRKKSSVPPPEPAPSEPAKRRRSARLSTDKEQLERISEAPKAPPVKQKVTKKTAPAETTTKKKKQITPVPEPQPEKKERTKTIGTQTPRQSVKKPTKIMLPFADTPVINRNKEMRKGKKDGNRRSSTGLRGRRASSLIESGMSNGESGRDCDFSEERRTRGGPRDPGADHDPALPHSEVEIHDFYKYIEQSLPEPRRMKQLLTWCGSRALPEKPSGDVKNANAIMAARAIQQELIDDFANKPELSDWFNRPEVEAPPVVKKPNPQNEKNMATLQDLEEEIKRLEEEKAAWDALTSPSSSLMPPPPAPSIEGHIPTLSDIDPSLLDPTQASIVASLQNPPSSTTADPRPPSSPSFSFSYSTPAALQAHLEQLSLSLEPHVDLFADGVHKMEQYRATAERVADRILGDAAVKLEEREKKAKAEVGSEGIGVGDVLRGLAGVLND